MPPPAANGRPNPTASNGKAEPYRHTIIEEAAALKTLLAITAEIRDSGQPPPENMAAVLNEMKPVIAQLQEIDDAGLLEAHVFLFRANRDIAADYAKYRDANREKLRDYLRRFYLHLP